MSPFDLQLSVFEHLARIGQALSSAPRLRLLGLLAQGEKPVERLAEQTGQSVASASAHLQVLKAANLVGTRREGRYVHYRLAGDAVLRFWLALRELGREQLPEIDLDGAPQRRGVGAGGRRVLARGIDLAFAGYEGMWASLPQGWICV